MGRVDLFVVRHAVAFERDAKKWASDAQRPLTSEGEDAFREAAKGIARAVRRPVEKVYASPFVRAWRTAELLQTEADWGAPVAMRSLGADRDVEEALASLRALKADGPIAVVGHEPQLSELCALLVGGAKVELRKGGLIRLEVEEFQPGGAGLRWLLPPRLLRRVG